MFSFEDYTLVIYEVSEELYSAIPERRFVAFLKEIPEPSLHSYGGTQLDALRNLKAQFEDLRSELKDSNKELPRPQGRDLEEYSGRLLLRLPAQIHRRIKESAEEEGISINSYIVNKLIETTTVDAVARSLVETLRVELKLPIWQQPGNPRKNRRQQIQDRNQSFPSTS